MAIIDLRLYVVDPATGETQLSSPEQHLATTPAWSFDGERIVWLADGVEGSIGPAVLVSAATGEAPFDPIPIAGTEDRPFDVFPTFPDW